MPPTVSSALTPEQIEHGCWVGFSRVSGIGSARVRKLLASFGTLTEAWHASKPEVQAAGLDDRAISNLNRLRPAFDIQAELDALARHNIQPLIWSDGAYPRRLKEIYDPPPVLYCRGDLRTDDEWAVAVVGTRRTTAYGRQVAEQFSRDLAAAGITVISGLALGIDSIAHRTALETGGRTLAVQACGLDLVYPAENTDLAKRVMTQGALLSEHPPGIRPTAVNFPMRNRIIAGLSLGVLVVEGDEKSGALITARQAVDQNRDVFAIPGSLLSTASAGPNKLIREGEAKLVRSASDILEELNIQLALAPAPTQSPPQPRQAASGSEARLLAELNWEPQHVDEIVRRTGMPAGSVAGLLTMLELKGMIRQVGALHYIRVKG